MSEVTSRNEWIFGRCKNILDDKDYLLRIAITQMLNKTTKMFKYYNLPKTIKTKDLEIQLQVNGFAIWYKDKEDLYTFTGGLGGVPNAYYLPTLATVANPYLNISKNLKIGEECVVMLNDHFYQGLMPLHNKYGSLLTEAEISLKYAVINARVPAIVSADNDTANESAEAFFKKITDGNGYGIVTTEEFVEGIKSHDFYKEPHIKDLIESIQYIKGSWYNELGLNAAFNMKREAINEAEATLNEDILFPSIDTMLECRQNALEKINEMYGTNITVELDSVWAKNKKLEKLNVEKVELQNEEIDTNVVDDNTNKGATPNESN